jgi:hypothetical protein
MPDHTIRIARLKMLFVTAKIRYSMHEQRAADLIDFLNYLDRRRKNRRTVGVTAGRSSCGCAKKSLHASTRKSIPCGRN